MSRPCRVDNGPTRLLRPRRNAPRSTALLRRAPTGGTWPARSLDISLRERRRQRPHPLRPNRRHHRISSSRASYKAPSWLVTPPHTSAPGAFGSGLPAALGRRACAIERCTAPAPRRRQARRCCGVWHPGRCRPSCRRPRHMRSTTTGRRSNSQPTSSGTACGKRRLGGGRSSPLRASWGGHGSGPLHEPSGNAPRHSGPNGKLP